MKRSTYIWGIIALTCLSLPAAQAAGPKASALAKPQVVDAYGHLPLSFEANQGQTDKRVRFLVRGNRYSLFLTANEAVLALKKKTGVRSEKSVEADFGPPVRLSPAAFPRPDFAALPAALLPTNAPLKDDFTPRDQALIPNPESRAPVVLRMRLVGANPHARVTGLDELPGKSNYFIGNDPKKWRTNVPNYAKVKYANVYPGVDLVYYGNQRQLEYDIVVQPGADPKAIKLEFAGDLTGEQATPLRIDGSGDLVVGTDGGEVIFHKPVVYQRPNDSRNGTGDVLEGKYVIRGDKQVTFEVARYDKTRPLVIDPTLAYSTYLGESDFDFDQGITVDALGNAYVTGATLSSDFPTTAGAFQITSGGSYDAFVSKLNTTGSALVYSTYLGGSGSDTAWGIKVDASRNAYVLGYTVSSNFPTTAGAFQTTYRGKQDAFVSKLNAAGSALVYSTYLGGSGVEGFNFLFGGIAVDTSGNAYVTGNTTSSDFPVTPGAFQTTFGGGFFGDAFVSKLNAAGSALVYSTYLGGSDYDAGFSVAVDSSGNAYVTGTTSSPDFPTTPGAFQTTLRGSGGAFISKLNAAGSALIYSTYLGGSSSEVGSSIAVDAPGNVYVTGVTGSSDFPTTPGAFQTTYGGDGDAFISKLNAAGSALLYSTYLGGSGGENRVINRPGAIAIDASGNAYVTGDTTSSDFPVTPGAFQTAFGGGDGDAFACKLNAAGSALLYSTYLGGSGADDGFGIAVDALRNAYVAGLTSSSNFPTTPGAFQTTLGGKEDAFVSKFSFGVGPPTNKAQCKKGGWEVFTVPREFKNQGNCVSFVNTGK